MNKADIVDVLIIGSGPAGLSCAIEALKRGLSTLVVDKGSLCDSIRRFPTDMTFFSTPELLELADVPFTCTSVRPSRRDVLQYYRHVAARKRIPTLLYTTVNAVTKQANGEFQCLTSGGELRARTVVLATGYFDTTNTLGVPGEELPHVHRYYTEPFIYSGCRVVVVGGRNSAVETALDLWRHGAHVHLVHRGPALADSVKYWQRPDMQNRLKAGEIIAHFSSRITRILPHKVEIEHVETAERESIPADFVIPHIGYRPDAQLFERCGIEFDADTIVASCNWETFESNVSGLYLAGSVLCGSKVWNIFIENGREHAYSIIADIQQKSPSQ